MVIFRIYAYSIRFIRNNIIKLWPFFLYCAFLYFSGPLLYKDEFNKSAIFLLINVLIFCFVEAYLIVAIYVEESVLEFTETLWQVTKGFYSSAVLLFVYSTLYVFLYIIFLTVLGGRMVGVLPWLIPVFIYYGSFVISLRHKIYYDTYTGSGMAGLKHLFSNLFFYILIAVIGIASLTLTFLLVFTPIAWVALILIPIMVVLMSASHTYAFISKNETNKHAA